jgi:uncharacterized RDD family membrane protein YckC
LILAYKYFNLQNIYLLGMQTVRIRTSQNIEIDYEVAGLGERILARIVDMGVFIGVFYIFYIIFFLFFLSVLVDMEKGAGFPIALIVIAIIFSVVYIFYDLVCEIFFNGQSIGKYAIKIKVVNLTGARPTIGQYLTRWVFRLLDFTLTFGIAAIISVAVSEKKQRIGDMIAGTTLIKTKPATALNELFFAAPEDDYEPLFAQANVLTDNDITLVNEVIVNFKRTGNSNLIYQMAQRLKEHLGVEHYPGVMNDYDFLQTIIKDYTYLTSRTSL